jgi:hypothetical protein
VRNSLSKRTSERPKETSCQYTTANRITHVGFCNLIPVFDTGVIRRLESQLTHKNALIAQMHHQMATDKAAILKAQTALKQVKQSCLWDS